MLATNTTRWTTKCSSNQTATTKINPATNILPSDGEEDSFIPDSVDGYAVEQGANYPCPTAFARTRPGEAKCNRVRRES
jgi:hypothetical protein